ncbi:MAG: MFS transporter [Bacteroidota bacterium]|nr:MFS transporter [Bacteroidota bacterium]
MTQKEKILLAIIAAIQFVHIVDFMIIMPLGPQLMRLFDIGPREFGFLVSSYTFSAGISGFLSVFYVDKFDRKKVLIVAFIGFCIGTFLCGMSPDFGLLLAARIVTGGFGGLLNGLILAIIGDAIPFERRGMAMGITMTGFSLASVFGVPFGLYIANMYDWHAPFIILAAVSLLVLAAIIFFVPAFTKHMENPSKSGPIKHFIEIITDKNSILALLLICFLVLGQFTVIPFISPYMVSNVGFSEKDLTYIYILGGFAAIFTTPIMGKLADKFGKPLIFTIFCLLTIIPILLITHMPKTELYLALIVTTIFFIFMGGRMGPAMAMITAAVKPQNRGAFMALNTSVMQLTSAFGSFLAGLIVVKAASGEMLNYNIVGYIAAVFGVLAVFIGNVLKPVD